MKSFRIFNRQTGSIIALVAMVFAVVAPTIASAAQLTERSVQLSSSSKNTGDVSYTFTFTTSGAAGGFVVDFCDDTPLIGESCHAPAGFDASAATSSTTNFTGVTATASNLKVVAASSAMTTPGAVTVVFDHIHNPTAVGPIYARIVTYDTSANLSNYQSPTDLGTYVDSGSAAINITDSIGVSAAVLESMVFCVSGQTIAQDCAGASLHAPTLQLGETTGNGIHALSAGAISHGDIYTQISTNAVSGAVVRLKSSATGCGGLVRSGAPGSCDIKPTQQVDLAAGTATFGVKVSSASGTLNDNDASGEYRVYPTSGYSTSSYALNYNQTDQSTGVTSPYGDPFLDTHDKPANNQNVTLTFGASINNATPAGLYSADLGLIATGKF